MLSKKHRFHGLGSLNYTYRRGMGFRSQSFGIKTTQNRLDTYRVAVVVSKKVTKKAPNRNRIRRRVYEAVRLTAPKYLTKQDIIITIFDDRFLETPFAEIQQSIEKQFKQISTTNQTV